MAGRIYKEMICGEDGQWSAGARAAIVAAAFFCAAWQGCGRLTPLTRAHSEGEILASVKERMQALEIIEGRGTLVLEYRDQTLEVPFGLRAAGNGLVEIEADVSSGFWPGLGRVEIVSDPTETVIYAGGAPLDASEYRKLGPMLRPMLLSTFGGGEMVVHWLVSNGCDVKLKTECSGLEVGLGVSLDHRSIERWTLKDRDRGISFNGYVFAWDTDSVFPRIVTGMFHPQEISVTVRFDQVHVARSPGNFIQTSGLE